ncbi:hypothetical protein GCM10018790_64240 [Kitasatospora xanthocidica]|nr:hypothetical protein GCM10018790_64240 [Kitasatospora xanthocidica]
MAAPDLPADLLPPHTAALRAERTMTEAGLTSGDVEAARGVPHRHDRAARRFRYEHETLRPLEAAAIRDLLHLGE